MRKFIAVFLMLGLVCSNAWALDMARFRELPSCVLAEDLSSIEDLERKGWTVSGNPTIADCQGDRCIDLDGTGDGLDSAFAHPGFSAFTVLGWVRVDADTSASVIFEHKDADSADFYRLELRADDKISLGITNGGSAQTSKGFSYTTGVWYHVGFSATTNSAKLYANGTLQETDTSLTLPTITGDVFGFGSKAGGSNPINGAMKQWLVFDRILTAAEISQIYNGTVFDYWQDEVAHWDMSEINPQDTGWKGNGHDGTGTGLAASTDIVYGFGDWGIEFNGSDEHIEAGTGTTLDLDSKTIAIVTRRDSDTGNVRVVAAPLAFTNDYQLLANAASQAGTWGLTRGDGANLTRRSNASMSGIGEVAYLTFTDSGSVASIQAYKDGLAVAMIADANDYDVKAGNFALGHRQDDASYYAGVLYDVRIYSSTLTGLQIEDLYIQTRSAQ